MRARGLAILAPLVVLAVACSSGEDGGGSGWAGFAAGDDGLQSIAAGLALLPDSGEDQAPIAWADLSRAAEIAGIDRPSDPGDEEAVVDYIQAVTGIRRDGDSAPAAAIAPEVVHVERGDFAGFADELGWSILDVDRFVERQTPPGNITVLQGSFDEGRLTDALGEPEDGTWTVGSGEPFAIDIDVSPARPMGESLWLTQTDDRLTVARSPDDSAAVRRAAAGEEDGETLADDDALAGLATALDAESPYAAMLVRPGVRAGAAAREPTPEQAEALCAQALPEPTAAVGTAVADDDGPVVLVGLAHESPTAAEANAEALERLVEEGRSVVSDRPWSELVSLDAVDVTDDGSVVVARLRPQDPAALALWHRVLVTQDSLVASC